MAGKKFTRSEKAHRAMERIPSSNESSAKITTGQAQRKGNLLEYVRSLPPDSELADILEKVLVERGRIRLSPTGDRWR